MERRAFRILIAGVAIVAALGIFVGFVSLYGDDTGGDPRMVGVVAASGEDLEVLLYSCGDARIDSLELVDGEATFWRLDGEHDFNGLATIDFRSPPPGLELTAEPADAGAEITGVLKVSPSGTFTPIGISKAVEALDAAGTASDGVWSDGELRSRAEFLALADDACESS